VVYDRTFDGRELEFGAVGLEKGVFFLYDEGTRSRWSQLVGRAVEGPLKGRALRKHPSTLTTWGRWRRLHPGTTVFRDPQLSGRRRFTEESLSRITLGGEAGDIVNEDLVVAVEGPRSARAWLLRLLASRQVANDEVDGRPLVVFLLPDAVTVRVWSRALGDRILAFAAEGDRMRDTETGTLWDALTGRALQGPLAGEILDPVVSTHGLWYAWRDQRPDTTLWSPSDP
jgi:hypothetical protein